MLLMSGRNSSIRKNKSFNKKMMMKLTINLVYKFIIMNPPPSNSDLGFSCMENICVPPSLRLIQTHDFPGWEKNVHLKFFQNPPPFINSSKMSTDSIISDFGVLTKHD